MRTTEHPPAHQQHAAEACCQEDGCCRGLLLGCVHSVKAFKASACLTVLATLAATQKLAVALFSALNICLAECATQPLLDKLLHDCFSNRSVTAANTSAQRDCQPLQRG